MQNELLYAWAITYRQAGWCVLPAEKKHPCPELGDWKRYQTQLPSLEETKEWFEGATADAQIALVTGQISGVSVIDIDCHRRGCGAKKELACDCRAQTPEDLLADIGISMTAKTGSGGYHVFCNYTSFLNNSTGLVHPQLDIKSEGGIIILPPSKHVYKVNRTDTSGKRKEIWLESGKYYEWWDMAPFNGNNLQNLMDFPEKLKTQIIEKPKSDWKRIVAGVQAGTRNTDSAALAGKLIRSFGEDFVSEAWELLWLWNEYRCEPPQDERDLKKTFESVAKKHFYGR